MADVDLEWWWWWEGVVLLALWLFLLLPIIYSFIPKIREGGAAPWATSLDPPLQPEAKWAAYNLAGQDLCVFMHQKAV